MKLLQTLLAVHFVVGCCSEFSSLNDAVQLKTIGAPVEFAATYKPSQSTADELLNWRFNSVAVAQLFIQTSGNFVNQTISSAFQDRLTFDATKSSSTFTMILTLMNVSSSDNGTLVTVQRASPNQAVLGQVTTLRVTVCPEQTNAIASSTNCVYNHYNCKSTFACADGFESSNSPFEATCLANGTWDVYSSCIAETTTAATTMSNGIVTTDSGPAQATGPVTNSFELGPGAIAGIVIGTVVGVLLILFLIWWFIEAFRSCLHNISDCFPEDHCCGKEYSKGSSS